MGVNPAPIGLLSPKESGDLSSAAGYAASSIAIRSSRKRLLSL